MFMTSLVRRFEKLTEDMFLSSLNIMHLVGYYTEISKAHGSRSNFGKSALGAGLWIQQRQKLHCMMANETNDGDIFEDSIYLVCYIDAE